MLKNIQVTKMNIKSRCNNKNIYEKTLDKIAHDITEYDFSDVQADNTKEACYNLAKDLYNADDEEADKIIEIIIEKYIHLIK